jgi:hypothetical protein
VKYGSEEYFIVNARVDNIRIMEDIVPEIGIARCGIFMNIIVCLS